MSIRPHYHRVIRSTEGDVRVNSTISLLQPGTSTPIVETIYSAASGSGVVTAPWVSSTGVVDFYLEVPAIVDILVTPTGGTAPVLFSNQWVGDPENRTYEGLSTAGAVVGQTPIADGTGGWVWGAISGGVSSLNGQTGDVVLTAASIGAVPATSDVDNVVVLTFAAYTALTPKVATTLYLIEG